MSALLVVSMMMLGSVPVGVAAVWMSLGPLAIKRFVSKILGKAP